MAVDGCIALSNDMTEQFGPIKTVDFRAFMRYPPMDEVEFYLRVVCYDGRVAYAKPEWIEIDLDDATVQSRPFLRLRPFQEVELHPLIPDSGGATLQVLMDDLWKCGVRPTEAVGSVGQLDAVQKHLKDMRRIAEKFLKINLP